MTPLTTRLSPLLEGFFTERLACQRDASPHTIAAYRDSFRLLLGFVHERTGKAPCKLELQDLDAAMIAAFLAHLETERGNSVRTRNARLTAVHSFFHYAALKAPECSELITRVLAIPEKRFDTTVISYLTKPEIDALLAAPDRSTWTGRRDHALLLLAVQTGLRASEIASLRRQDLQLDGSAWVRCRGKGDLCRIRHRPPSPWRINSDPRRSSMSVSFSANASEIRSPARHNTATSARTRSPWRSCPAWRITSTISSARGGSGGYCIPLLRGARPARYPGIVAGDRRRPAALIPIVEPEDMTGSPR
jgi:integrase